MAMILLSLHKDYNCFDRLKPKLKVTALNNNNILIRALTHTKAL